LLFSDMWTAIRFIYFDHQTSFLSLFVYPAALSVATVCAYPWANYYGALILVAPRRKLRHLQIEERFIQKTIEVERQSRLEEVTLELQEQRQSRIISEAKALDEIENIKSESVKNDAKEKLSAEQPKDIDYYINRTHRHEATLLHFTSINSDGKFKLWEQGGNYLITLNGNTSKLPSREEFLYFRRAIENLQKMQIIESVSRDQYQLNVLGYDLMNDPDFNRYVSRTVESYKEYPPNLQELI